MALGRYLQHTNGSWLKSSQEISAGTYPDDGAQWAEAVAAICGLAPGSLTVVDSETDPRSGDLIEQPADVTVAAEPGTAERIAQVLIDSSSIDSATKGALVVALRREAKFSVVQTEGVSE